MVKFLPFCCTMLQQNEDRWPRLVITNVIACVNILQSFRKYKNTRSSSQVCFSRTYHHVSNGVDLSEGYLVDKGCTWNTTTGRLHLCEPYMKPCEKYMCEESLCNYKTSSGSRSVFDETIFLTIFGLLYTTTMIKIM